MGLVFRKRLRFGPFIWNFGKSGFTSWGIKLGAWSWNSRSKAHTVNLPGPFSWHSKGR